MKTLRTRLFLLLAALALPLLLAYCATTPYTGRTQIMMVSQSEELSLGERAAREILKEEKLSQDPAINAQVRGIGERIAAVSSRPDFNWEFFVIDKDVANAFVLPGGKVFVYTGILKYATNDAQLATVMGHEVAHALLRHGAERMSMAMAAQGVGTIGAIAIGGAGGSGAGQIFAQSYGLAANVGVILPFSRRQEEEADHVGLRLMAEAGYDPAMALEFWQNMAADEDAGQRPPTFLSTHPATQDRIENIRALVPWARGFYRPRTS